MRMNPILNEIINFINKLYSKSRDFLRTQWHYLSLFRIFLQGW